MRRRTVLGLGLLAAFTSPSELLEAADKPAPVNTKELTPETKAWFESRLVIPGNAVDDSDWSEIIARFGTVLLGRPLPAEARTRCIARANSTRADKVFLFGDLSPGKRAMCYIIVKLDDKLRI